MFVKALNIIMQGAKIVAPMVTLPAISVPALSAFTEALSYWEDRTRFIMAGNLTTAVATQQALADPDREDRYIGLLSGDYLMVPQKHTDELAKRTAESRPGAGLPGAQGCRSESAAPGSRAERDSRHHLCFDAGERATARRQIRPPPKPAGRPRAAAVHLPVQQLQQFKEEQFNQQEQIGE